MSELTVQPDQLSKLRALTGLQPKSEYNTIRLTNSAMADKTETEVAKDPNASKKKANPDYGKLFAYKDGNETRIDMKTAEFYLARQRVQVTCTKMVLDSEGKKKPKYWCRETDDSFIEIHERGVEEVVKSGMYQDLKKEYGLKWNNVAYVYYDGDVYRWKLSGAHDWFPISRILGKNPAQTFKIADMVEDTSGDFPYYGLSFEIANPFDPGKAVEISQQVAEMLNEYYNKVAAESAMEPSPDELIEATKDLPDANDMPTDLPFDKPDKPSF